MLRRLLVDRVRRGLDAVSDNEDIERELLAEVFGDWDFVKNSDEWRDRNATWASEYGRCDAGKTREPSPSSAITCARRSASVVGEAAFRDAVAFRQVGASTTTARGFHDPTSRREQVHPPGLCRSTRFRSLYARDIAGPVPRDRTSARATSHAAPHA